ncbi:hypothetical protein V8E55_011877 [Tylopilus felleus]
MPALFDFPNPAPTSSCAVEQEMLDHGTLTQEDINIQTYGLLLPNLGTNFHMPKALMDAVNYYLTYNALTSAGVKPLTSYVAHTPPKDPEFAENLNRQDTMGDINDTNDINQEIPCEGDEDIPFESNDDKEAEEELDEENLVSFATQNDPLDSSPDPFKPPSNFQSTFSTTLPPHLLVIYATITWLHLQWHLLCTACNALLAIMAFCPQCLDVFPAAGSLHTQDSCLACSDRANKIPYIKYPYLPLSQQIQSLLAIPGLEKALDEWQTKPCTPGQYQDIFNGDMCHSKLKDPDGKIFFSNGTGEANGPNGSFELVFSYIHSNIAPLHSSCPTSFSICNLPSQYRTANLLLTSILPGPKEQNPDQIQHFLRPISCPKGRLVRVIFVVVVCDKPAAHKLGGFGSHSHTYFCTACWITRADNDKPTVFMKDKFATCYTELSRLPYFNLVEQIVVDLMHNLFLGLVKTHFYNIWVQGKILRAIHELSCLPSDFIVPAACGKLPTNIGMSSGGSLTANQWLLLSTIYGPIIISHEAEKTVQSAKKAGDSQALKAAKAQGKDVYKAEKAWIAQEKVIVAELKKAEKLKANTAKQAEKAHVLVEKKIEKARLAEQRWVYFWCHDGD